MKIQLMTAELFRADLQTDRHEEGKICSSNYAIAPQDEHYSQSLLLSTESVNTFLLF